MSRTRTRTTATTATRRRTRRSTAGENPVVGDSLITIGSYTETLASRRVGEYHRVTIEHEGEEWNIELIDGGGIEVRCRGPMSIHPKVSNVVELHPIERRPTKIARDRKGRPVTV